MMIPVVLALMTCMAAMSAAGTRVDRAGAKRNVLKVLGPTVVVCGTFAGQPYRTARKLSPSDKRVVDECITTAWKARKPFVFAVEGSVIDSWAATGLLGTKEGKVKVYWYDSAPCGNDACPESFELFACVVEPGTERLDAAMKCTDADMPQTAAQQSVEADVGAAVRAPRHSASLRRSSVPQCTFFTNVPSQLNAVLGTPRQG